MFARPAERETAAESLDLSAAVHLSVPEYTIVGEVAAIPPPVVQRRLRARPPARLPLVTLS
jgi:hypothetical protein